MALSWQTKEGWSSINSYALPGIPYLFTGTSSDPALRIKFPLVTKYIDVRNTATGGSTEIKVGFSQAGVSSGSQYVTLAEGQEPRRFDVRVTEIWVLASSGTPTFEVSAGLSSAENPTTLTGSLGPVFEGIG